MQSPILMGPTLALELVVLPVEAPRSITLRLHLVHLQGAASTVAPPFSHVVIVTIPLTIVAGPLRSSTS